jgi:hypothetical protein
MLFGRMERRRNKEEKNERGYTGPCIGGQQFRNFEALSRIFSQALNSSQVEK